MLTEKLLEILNGEEKVLASILRTAEKKQLALVGNDRDALDACVKEEENLLPRLKELELSRVKAVQNIYTVAGKKTTDFTITSLIQEFEESLSEEEKNNLESKQRSIKEMINAITKLNSQNLYLINHSRQFINETINAIINSADRSILDKKV